MAFAPTWRRPLKGNIEMILFEDHLQILWSKLRAKMKGYYGCQHLSVDGCGRCDECGEWAPFFNPPERGPVKRVSEFSIIAVNNEP